MFLLLVLSLPYVFNEVEIHNITLAENIPNRKMLVLFSQLFREAGCLQRGR